MLTALDRIVVPLFGKCLKVRFCRVHVAKQSKRGSFDDDVKLLFYGQEILAG